MKSATISISKIVSVITEKSVQNFKMNEFDIAISGLDVFTMTGISKPAKIAKYQDAAVKAGFELSKTVWFDNAGFDGANSDVMNYNFIYTKLNN